MADLLGDPAWPQLHPRSTRAWPGLQCEAAPDDARVLRATRLHFGPDVATPPCRPGARLGAASLRGLPHLKTLSLFGCFASGGAGAGVELPAALFAGAAPSSLEQIVLKSNPGPRGPMPATLGRLRSLRVLSLSQNAFGGGIPRELAGLAALQQLDLSYNNITGEVNQTCETKRNFVTCRAIKRLLVVTRGVTASPFTTSRYPRRSEGWRA